MRFSLISSVVCLFLPLFPPQTPTPPSGSATTVVADLVWRELPREGAAPLRFVVRAAAPSEGLARSFVLVVASDDRDLSLETAARDVARALPESSTETTIVAASGDSAQLLAMLDSVTNDASGSAQRAHVIGTAAGARAALRFAIDHPEHVASVTAFAPTSVGEVWLERATVLANVPVALLRGRDDDRAPMLELLERWIEVGSASASFDFVSTREHATLLDNEGRFREHWARFVSAESERANVEAQVRALLTEFHAAAARADGTAYFACLSADAIFIGTDSTERWTVPQFRSYCEPHFKAGRGWTYVGFERHVILGADRTTGWFDERLKNEKYGEVRGSGVARLEGDRWRIAHYVMSFPVPNDVSQALVELIRKPK